MFLLFFYEKFQFVHISDSAVETVNWTEMQPFSFLRKHAKTTQLLPTKKNIYFFIFCYFINFFLCTLT